MIYLFIYLSINGGGGLEDGRGWKLSFERSSGGGGRGREHYQN